jgi:hypothetical protein
MEKYVWEKIEKKIENKKDLNIFIYMSQIINK